MKIRFAKDQDYAEMARLHKGTIRTINAQDYPKDVIEAWSARSKAKKFRINADKLKRWVAIENEKIVGFCDHNLQCELMGLYVHKNHMRKGIGLRLLKKAEASMKKLGCKKISIESSVTAKKFYMKNGYKVLRRGIHVWRSQSDCLPGYPPERVGQNKKATVYMMEKIL